MRFLWAVLSMLSFFSSASAAEMFASKDSLGQAWIQIVGPIETGDDVKFKELLLSSIQRGHLVSNVSIYSPGGKVVPAIKIGRYIRTLSISSVAPHLLPRGGGQLCHIHNMQGKTTSVIYDPKSRRGDSRCVCASACFLIWAAGASRLGDALQMHSISMSADEFAQLSPQAAKATYSANQQFVENYLREMGIPELTVARMFSISSDKIEFISASEIDLLANKGSQPWLTEFYNSRCLKLRPLATAPLKAWTAYNSCVENVNHELLDEGLKKLKSAEH